jgi:hypothetical protein
VRGTLESKGYTFSHYVAGANHYRYLAPTSESGEAGVIVFQGKGGDWCTYSHHSASDPLSGHLTDPFRLYATFEHNGDLKSAARGLILTERMASLLTATRKHNAAPPPSPALPAFEGPVEETVSEAILGADETLAKATLLLPFDPATLPPRRWIYGRHLIRQFVSITVAPGGVGKSSLLIGDALAMVSGKPIMGQSVPAPLRVWLWNMEDPLDELKRRIAAAMQHHGLSWNDLGGRLYLDSGRDQGLCTAITGRDGGPQILAPVVDALVAEMQRRQIDAFLADPFVSTHQVSENDNGAMDAVGKSWGHVAQRTTAAIGLVHHSRKQMDGADMTAESARGGKALTDAAREVRVLQRMSPEEAAKAGVENNRLFFQVRSDKQNLAAPSQHATWFKLHDVPIPNGDQVGVVAPWEWPEAMDGVSVADLRRVQTALDCATHRADPRADQWAGNVVMDVLGIDPQSMASKAKVKLLLAEWIKSGALIQEAEIDPKSRKHVTVVRVGTWAIEGVL